MMGRSKARSFVLSMFASKPRGYQPPIRPHRLPPTQPSPYSRIRTVVKRRIADGPFGRIARLAVERHTYIIGHFAPNCEIAPTANINNVSINASSGIIRIGDHSFFGSGVTLIAGTHDVEVIGEGRKSAITVDGYDVTIGEGVFVASNATIIGPCVVGDHAVVCAGAVVIKDVPAYAIVGGVPAKVLRYISARVES